MKQKIWQYLPRDLLHCVYSEWLTWSDLSVLDIACLSHEDREEWLPSVSFIVKTSDDESARFIFVLDHNEKLVNYYQWLGSRKVLVRDGFPMRLSVLEDFLRYCDPVTFCPALHSILILDDEIYDTESCDISSEEESKLSCFLSHCSRLEEVNFDLLSSYDYDYDRQDNIIYTALNQHLRDNQLVKAQFRFTNFDDVIGNETSNVLSKHVNSLKEIVVVDNTEQCCGVVRVFENLIHYKHTLHVLDIGIQEIMLCDPTPLLLQCASSSGKFLQELKFRYSGENAVLTNELLCSIGTACPNLQQLRWIADRVSENVKPIEIYRLCPNLKCISLNDFILMIVNKEENGLNLRISKNRIYARLVDSMECVLLALQRGQYSQVGLCASFELEDEEWKLVLKTIGSVLTYVEVEVTEDALIRILPNLPRLRELTMTAVGTITDRSLAAIMEYRHNLIDVSLFCDADYFECSDEMIIQMIRNCQKLEGLVIPCAGCESILCAASCLPKLRLIEFADVRASRADIVSLLCGGEMRWSPYLTRGYIGNFIRYDRRSQSWVEVK
eukprot:scaffold1561_cov184-Ochromonas_danica.AAC.1